MNLGIVIPAYNEEKRIQGTLQSYSKFFADRAQKEQFSYELIVVLNGCRDNTLQVVEHAAQEYGNIHIMDLTESGKGLAIKEGFKRALERGHDLIGFVDADMATEPQYFYELISHTDDHHGVIASRYLPESQISPKRPAIKTWGRKIVYNGMTRLLFGLKFSDLQCGAKLFTRDVVASITPHLTVKQWAFDVELLYLAQKHGYRVHEKPTVWTDKDGSKLQTFRAGMWMLWSLIAVRITHSPFKR